ncbi:MAG: hypothetical protein U9P50_02255 [Patescibacteria group bacterium]|nr:hypothetical protein [Patescibacteria group bacterium]
MKKMLTYKNILPILILLPLISFAAEDILGVITKIKEILSAIVPLIVSLAVIFFIWSTAQYILKEGDAKNEAKSHMTWGIVILFVIISVWSLVAILEETFL